LTGLEKGSGTCIPSREIPLRLLIENGFFRKEQPDVRVLAWAGFYRTKFCEQETDVMLVPMP